MHYLERRDSGAGHFNEEWPLTGSVEWGAWRFFSNGQDERRSVSTDHNCRLVN